jgi:ribose 5-phosphate isomerase
MQAAKLFVVIADHRKKVEHLGTAWKYVPIEVLPMAYKPIQLRIQVRTNSRLIKDFDNRSDRKLELQHWKSVQN